VALDPAAAPPVSWPPCPNRTESPIPTPRLASLPLLAFAAGCAAALGGGEGAGPAGSVTVAVVVPSPPPAEGADRAAPSRPAAPGFGYIWVAGHWDNVDGLYVWKPGRWVQGRAGYDYVRARYEFDAQRRQWIYHRPHWRRRHVQAVTIPPPPPAPPSAGGDGGAAQRP